MTTTPGTAETKRTNAPPQPIRRLLIANRGEIAVRVIRACSDLGIDTVAVYSDADARAPHVHFATDAYWLGAADPAESYLNIERIVAAAKATQADAIHPGYGFLSENPEFAEACERAGINFVGPPPAAMRAAADKTSAKALASQCDVPTVPVFDLASIPADAYPVLVKAAAGGGGRGMRIVRSATDLEDAVAAARREAKSAFGSEELLVEKLIEGGRHVEVQLLADKHGNVVYVGDRDCSLQRRHQKVVEEAPAPGLGYDLQTSMGEAAVAIAKAAGYVNAGTAEFLVANDGSYYFLELNARLQVEHPATECAFGIDLVHQQLRIAMGEPLMLTQDAIRPIAHAIEARVYAEHPVTMLPTGGRLLRVELPDKSHVRVDHSLAAGELVSLHYDPLLAKVIASGATREEARVTLLSALADMALPGVIVNIPLVRHALSLDQFVTDNHSIATLEAHPLSASAIEGSLGDAQNARTQFRTQHHSSTPFDSYTQSTHSTKLRGLSRSGETLWYCVDGTSYSVPFDHIDRTPKTEISDHGGAVAAINSPMPGSVLQIMEEGTHVESGETVAVIEAMKMENAVAAPFAGTVTNITCVVGDSVVAGATLAEVTR